MQKYKHVEKCENKINKRLYQAEERRLVTLWRWRDEWLEWRVLSLVSMRRRGGKEEDEGDGQRPLLWFKMSSEI